MLRLTAHVPARPLCSLRRRCRSSTSSYSSPKFGLDVSAHRDMRKRHTAVRLLTMLRWQRTLTPSGHFSLRTSLSSSSFHDSSFPGGPRRRNERENNPFEQARIVESCGNRVSARGSGLNVRAVYKVLGRCCGVRA